MKLSDFIWEKVGAIAIAALLGAIYGIIVSPIILYFFPRITMPQVINVFCLSFSAIGIISSDFLIKSTIGLIYTIAGFSVGLGAVGSSCSEEVKKCLRTSIGFTLLGIICGVMTVILYGL
jgi:hypothetical protein